MKLKPANLLILLIFLFVMPLRLLSNFTIDSLIQVSVGQKLDTVQFQRYFEIAKRYSNFDLDSAIIYAEKSIEIAKLLDDKKKFGDVSMVCGVYYLMKNNSEKGYENLSNALELYKAINESHNVAKVLNNIGIYYNERGMLEKALESYLEAAEYLEDSGSIRSKAMNGVNIGIVYLDQTNYDMALIYFYQAFEMFSEIDDTYGLAITNSNIGDVFIREKEFDKALQYHTTSYQCELKLNSSFGIAHELNKIGVIFYRQQKFHQALDTLKKALQIREDFNGESGICESSLNIGKVFNKLNDLSKAEKFCRRTYDLAHKINSDFWIQRSSKELSLIYERKNDFRNALKYHKIYKITTDSMFSASKIKELTELAMNYEFQKEKVENKLKHETELLNQKHIRIFYILSLALVLLFIGFILNLYLNKKKANRVLLRNFTIIDQQAKELKIANATKDKFFSIIAHDLRSPFNTLMGFSDLLEKKYEEYPDSQRVEIIKILSKTSKNTFFLLDNLLTWSRSQLGNIVIKKDILNLFELVSNSIVTYQSSALLKNIEIVVEIKHEIEVYVDLATIKIVIGNLVNNAIKFTPLGGKIRINAIEKEKMLEVCIHDTGIGMNKETVAKLFRIEESFTTEGTNKEKGTGLGLILCKEFVNKNGGEIWVESELGIGSCFTFEISKK